MAALYAISNKKNLMIFAAFAPTMHTQGNCGRSARQYAVLFRTAPLLSD